MHLIAVVYLLTANENMCAINLADCNTQQDYLIPEISQKRSKLKAFVTLMSDLH